MRCTCEFSHCIWLTRVCVCAPYTFHTLLAKLDVRNDGNWMVIGGVLSSVCAERLDDGANGDGTKPSTIQSTLYVERAKGKLKMNEQMHMFPSIPSCRYVCAMCVALCVCTRRSREFSRSSNILSMSFRSQPPPMSQATLVVTVEKH